MKAVLFDNAGGVTLVCKEWCHTYHNIKQAAEDFIEMEKDDSSVELWDGNEFEEMAEYIEEGKFDKEFSFDEFGEFCATCEDVEEIMMISLKQMVIEVQKIKSQQ